MHKQIHTQFLAHREIDTFIYTQHTQNTHVATHTGEHGHTHCYKETDMLRYAETHTYIHIHTHTHGHTHTETQEYRHAHTESSKNTKTYTKT